jgi:hypothetical protein
MLIAEELIYGVKSAALDDRSLQAKQKPTGRLLGACSGRRPMGYRFSLLTLLFSGVIKPIKPYSVRKFRPFL